MFRPFLLLTLSLFCLHSFAQTIPNQTSKQNWTKLYPMSEQLAGGENLNASQPGATAPLSSAKVSGISTTSTTLGRSSNAYTFIRNSQNQLAADPQTGFLAFVHRQDVTVFGGGGMANGYLRVDFSTDYGKTWTLEDGPMQLDYTFRARYPQLVLHRDLGSDQPLDNHFVWAAATLDGNNNWLGHVYGATQPGSGPGTENYLFNNDPTLIPGGLTKGLPGEFWNCEFVVRNSLLEDTLILYKGVWNTTSQDVDWTIQHRIPIGGDRQFDGNLYFSQPVLAFSPDGSKGWIAFLGDLTEAASPMGQDSIAFAPILIHSTDGGQTWGSPMELNLNEVGWLKDTLLHGPQDSLGNPLASGIASTAFELDVVVDGNGEAHLGAVICNGGGDYSIETSGKMFLGHIYTQNGGNAWGLEFLNPIYTLRGTTGIGVDLLTYDNHIQASRDMSGNYVLFSFTDSDTSLSGFGNPENIAPNVYLTGKSLQDNYTLCKWIITEGNLFYDGKAYFHTISPEFFIHGSGRIMVPMVMMNFITIDQEQPCGFDLIGPDLAIGTNSFCEPTSYQQSHGWENPFPLCRPDAVDENELENKLQLAFNPNPASQWVEITAAVPDLDRAHFSLTDLTGRTLKEWNASPQSDGTYMDRLDLSNYPAGLYHIKMESGTSRITKPIVIQH